MKIEDLTPYNYDPPRFEGELAVGWLDGDIPAESIGRIEPDRARTLLIERLTFAAAHLQTTAIDWMGTHNCSFCDGPQTPLDDRGLSIWGNGEFRVLDGDDTIYVAPTLIAHYVEAHDYLPPAKFVDAVFRGGFIEEATNLDPLYDLVGCEPASNELRDALGEETELALIERSPWNGESPRPMIGIAVGRKVFGPWDGSIDQARTLANGEPLIFDRGDK